MAESIDRATELTDEQAVRILDRWRLADTRRQHVERSADASGTRCEVELYYEVLGSQEFHYGATPTAARLSAAEAILSEDPSLGEP